MPRKSKSRKTSKKKLVPCKSYQFRNKNSRCQNKSTKKVRRSTKRTRRSTKNTRKSTKKLTSCRRFTRIKNCPEYCRVTKKTPRKCLPINAAKIYI